MPGRTQITLSPMQIVHSELEIHNIELIPTRMSRFEFTGEIKLASTVEDTRERRKVQLVEQPGQKVTGRSSQLARPLPATQERHLSSNEIQKAKLRAQFMQSKYGKPVTASDGSPKKFSQPHVGMSQATSRSSVRAKVEEHKKPTTNEPKLAPVSNKMNQDVYEPVSKKIKRVQISWQTPPEATTIVRHGLMPTEQGIKNVSQT